MSPSAKSLHLNPRLEDVLAYLPISNTKLYKKNEVIYGPDAPSQSIHLIVSGKVGISQIAGNGRELLLEIILPEELFGESAFLDVPCRCEQADALEKTSVMSWAITEVEGLVMKQPRLAVALMQVLARRNIEFTRRIDSFSTETIERRLARSLVRFSERLGTRQEDGSLRMMPLTHDQLSRYVGTSREIITRYMNVFRRQGYLTYSRQGIVLYRDALNASIN
jgi:CRP/FNR family cyclic AMP-dependent transcriptional regulator